MQETGRGPGDPEGRRLSRQRAAFLAEAGRVGAALDVLLRRADFDDRDGLLIALLGQVASRERSELMKADGRIEPRRRFKNRASNPLRDMTAIDLLNIDESGVSYLSTDDSVAPWFALGAVSLSEEAARSYSARADSLKHEFFKGTAITFHEPMMRNREGPFYFDGDEGRQAEFDVAVNQLLADTDFVVFGVAIRKGAFREDFVESGLDPYLPTDVYFVAIQMLLERYVDYLATHARRPRGRVTFEAQGTREDAEHQHNYVDVLLNGTQWIAERPFQTYLETGVTFVPKGDSHPTEIADMVARDLFEWVRGGCEGSPLRWRLFTDRAYARGDRRHGKFGIKIFPDSDIRDRIEEHRDGAERG